MIYFNNATTSYPKPKEVIEAVTDYASRPQVASGRSVSSNDPGNEDVITSCRKTLARFFNIDQPNNIIFTSGSTYGFNLVINGLQFNHTHHVITTAIEHNSVLRPLKLQEKEHNLNLTIVDCDAFGTVHPDAVAKAIKPTTKAIFLSQSSNVVGAVTDIKTIAEIAHRKGILVVVDAAQSAGCMPIDVKELGIDILVFTGHKSLFGMAGIGGVYFPENVHLAPLVVGGTGFHSESLYQVGDRPIYYESGTPNFIGIASLQAGILYIEKTGIETMNKQKEWLFHKVIEQLEKNPAITVYGRKDHYSAPIISFNIKNMLPADVGALLLNHYQIMTRAGLHCAPLIHKTLNTYPVGTVRISFSNFNTVEECNVFLDAINEITRRHAVVALSRLQPMFERRRWGQRPQILVGKVVKR